MIYTKEKFKKLWKSGKITIEDYLDCAKAWGICEDPRLRGTNYVIGLVRKAANIEN